MAFTSASAFNHKFRDRRSETGNKALSPGKNGGGNREEDPRRSRCRAAGADPAVAARRGKLLVAPPPPGLHTPLLPLHRLRLSLQLLRILPVSILLPAI